MKSDEIAKQVDELREKIHQDELQVLAIKRRQMQTRAQVLKLQSDLDAARRMEADEGKPRALLANGEEYVIDKVTPLRIYLRKAGDTRVEQYSRGGEPIRYFGHAIINRAEIVALANSMKAREK